ncbi:MAG: peroxiredoxin [Bacteroidetes bacterium]|nr:peroxiredoxin [Bacteroidota bacterium]
MSTKLKPGDIAPDFELFDQNLNKFRLGDLINDKPVVIFFYPKDETKICTKEACCFRDKYDEFIKHGVEVIGISCDSVESHQIFSDKHKLPYRILSDREGSVKDAYGVSKVLGIIKGRETFVVNKEGKIIKIYRDAFSGEEHVEQALEALN